MSATPKPNAEALRWQIEESSQPYQNDTLSLKVDKITLRDGEQIQYSSVERAEAVIVVPVTRDGDIVTVKQYRYPVDEWCIEVPAGGMHDTGGEPLPDVARSELREEIGATCGRLTYIGFFYTAPSFTSEKCHVFLAEGVDTNHPPNREPSEQIKIQLAAADEVVAMARSGKMMNAPCALAVLLCEPLLRERGYI
ncbi:MAG TPA: NUDIX hydrolase [Chthoniobacterales bacterium]|jgi:ADP-ribose pyrophosphatase